MPDTLPIIAFLSYDSNSLYVTWQSTFPPGLSYFLVVLYEVDGPLRIEQQSTTTYASIPAQLSTTQTYKVYVQEFINNQPGPKSNELTVITVAPQLTSLYYTGAVVGSYWNPVTVQGSGAYAVSLYDTGGTYNNTQSTTDISYQFQYALQPSTQYQVKVSATSPDGVVVGPASIARTVIQIAPLVTLLTYNLAIVGSYWSQVTAPGAGTYSVSLYDTTGTYNNSQQTSSLSYNFQVALESSKQYQVKVAAQSPDGVVVGPSSLPRTIIQVAPEQTLLTYDLTVVASYWSQVNVPDAGSYAVSLSDTSGSYNNTQSTTDLSYQFQVALDINSTYRVTVSATSVDGVVIGPASVPRTVIQVAPQIASLSYNFTVTGAYWVPVIVTGAGGYAVSLYDTGGTYNNTQYTLNIFYNFDATLDINMEYQVKVSATSPDRVVIGPASIARTVIQIAPLVTLLTYNLAIVGSYWSQVTAPGAGTYSVSLYDTTGTYNNSQQTSSLSYNFQVALESSKQYQVKVAAQSPDGVVVGPSSLPRTIIQVAPEQTLLTYDLTVVASYWSQVNVPDAGSYAVSLSDTSGSYNNTQSTTDLSYQFQVALDINSTYRVTVSATSVDGVVIGPASSGLIVIQGTPTIQELDYDAANLSVAWSKVDQSVVTGYSIKVSETGGSSYTFDVGNTDHTTVSIELRADKSYQVELRATGDKDLGPFGPPLAPLTSSPRNVQLNYTGTQFKASWLKDSNPQVTYYIAQLSKNGNVFVEIQVQEPPAVFDYTIENGIVYSAIVRDAGDRVKGPWTALVYGPYAAAVTMDYDAQSRIKIVKWNNQQVFTYAIDDSGNILSESYSQITLADDQAKKI